MIKLVIGMILAGGVTGYLFAPEFLLEHQGILINVLLCIVLFTIGIELGQKDNAFKGVKEAGYRIALIPLLMIGGTLLFGGLSGLLCGIPIHEAMAVSAGFGWYSLGPILIADYSASLSAVAFLCNVIRETLGIILIPIIAKKIGYIECVAAPGISAMDLCLPIIERSANENVFLYAFVGGTVMSASVSVLIPLFLAMG